MTAQGKEKMPGAGCKAGPGGGNALILAVQALIPVQKIGAAADKDKKETKNEEHKLHEGHGVLTVVTYWIYFKYTRHCCAKDKRPSPAVFRKKGQRAEVPCGSAEACGHSPVRSAPAGLGGAPNILQNRLPTSQAQVAWCAAAFSQRARPAYPPGS